jgi:hypothetical protein
MMKPGEELFYSSVAPATPAGLLFFYGPHTTGSLNPFGI